MIYLYIFSNSCKELCRYFRDSLILTNKLIKIHEKSKTFFFHLKYLTYWQMHADFCDWLYAGESCCSTAWRVREWLMKWFCCSRCPWLRRLDFCFYKDAKRFGRFCGNERFCLFTGANGGHNGSVCFIYGLMSIVTEKYFSE